MATSPAIPYSEGPYYPALTIALAANEQKVVPWLMRETGILEWRTCEATNIGVWEAQIILPQSRALSPERVNSALGWGNAYLPFVLEMPIIIEPNQTLYVDIKNLTAGALTVQLQLGCKRRIYR